MGKYFGTDGFRGEANKDLTVDHAFKIGRYLGWYYGQQHKARVVIGKDTRRSSYMFEYALCAGLTASGADVRWAPTCFFSCRRRRQSTSIPGSPTTSPMTKTIIAPPTILNNTLHYNASFQKIQPKKPRKFWKYFKCLRVSPGGTLLMLDCSAGGTAVCGPGGDCQRPVREVPAPR